MGIEDDFLSGPGEDVMYSEDEEQDTGIHEKLLKDIATLSNKKKSKMADMRTEPASRVSEFGFSSSSEGKVRLYELVGSLDRGSKSGKMKKQLSRVEKRQKIIDTPLSKTELEKIHRVVGYETASKQVSKWDPVVKENRKAKQMHFPLNQPDLRVFESTAELVSTHVPHTDLEKEVAELLNENRAVLPGKNAELSKAEEEALKAVSIEEAALRRAELQKQRALLSYYSAKLKRQGKIKSKSYHRIKRKSEKKKEGQKMEMMKQDDPEGYQRAIRKAEQNRIQERMSLKHKGTSQFMKKQMIYGKYDATGRYRQSVQEMLRIGEDLKKKSAVSLDESEEESEDSTNEDQDTDHMENNPWNQPIKIAKPNNTKVVEEVIEIKETSSEPPVTVDKIKKKDKKDKQKKNSKKKQKRKEKVDHDGVPAQKKLKKSEDNSELLYSNSRESDGDDDDDVDDDVEQGESNDDMDHYNSRVSGEHSKTSKNKPTNKAPQNTNNSKSANKAAQNKTSAAKVVTTVMMSHALPVLTQETEDPAEVERDSDEQRRLTLSEAFAEDNIVEDFLAEKREIEERDKPKDIDLTLPGWGEWTGPGVTVSSGKRKKFIIKAPPGPPRRDQELPDVIINELKDESIAKLQVNSLPFPFHNVVEFQKSVSKPIGADVNPVAAFKRNIKPHLVTRLGQVIEPISKAETFGKNNMPKWVSAQNQTNQLEVKASKTFKRRK